MISDQQKTFSTAQARELYTILQLVLNKIPNDPLLLLKCCQILKDLPEFDFMWNWKICLFESLNCWETASERREFLRLHPIKQKEISVDFWPKATFYVRSRFNGNDLAFKKLFWDFIFNNNLTEAVRCWTLKNEPKGEAKIQSIEGLSTLVAGYQNHQNEPLLKEMCTVPCVEALTMNCLHKDVQFLACGNWPKLKRIDCFAPSAETLDYFKVYQDSLEIMTIFRGSGLSNFIYNCPRLRKLSVLNMENLNYFPLIRNLRVLTLGHCSLLEIPTNIDEMHGLETLVLAGNQISTIPSSIGNLLNLFELRLSNNKIRSLPDLSRLPLTTLDLSYNLITQIPKPLAKENCLLDLSLSHNAFSLIPLAVLAQRNLRKLNLSLNKISNCSPAIGTLSNLVELDLSYNKLKRVPPTVGNLGLLESIDLTGNKLDQAPNLVLSETLQRVFFDIPA